jgi:hypothetical protein
MKQIFLFLFLAATFAAHGQYGNNPNKIRLGNQTSGDGLVYRGSGAPAYTPSDYKNAWVYIDSVAGRMYTYRGGAWEFVSAGAGVDSLAYRNDSLFVYSPDTTFFVVIDRTITVAGSSGTPQTVDPGQTVTIAAGNGVTTTAGATRILTVAADTGVLASKTYTTNALALKLNLGDTATMLAPYQRDISLTTTGTSGAATFSSNILNIPQYQAALTNPVTGTGTTNYLAKFTGTSSIGNGIASDDGTRFSLDDASTSTAKPFDFDSWTTAARPAVPMAGDAGYNTTLGLFEGYGASAWMQKSFPAGTTSQTIRHDGTSWVASSNLYHDGTGVGIGATSLGSARLVLKNSQEPSRSTVVATQGFAADTTNWTKGTGWTFSGTTAVATAATGDLTYTPALTITSGNAYEVTYTISGYSAGTLTLAVGNATYVLPAYNLTGNVVVVLPTSATGGFRFTTSTFTGVLDNVTVVQVATPAPVLLAGQDDGGTTAYNPVRMPNSTTWAQGGGGGYVTGGSNNFFGYQAGYNSTTGDYNNFFGYQAGYNSTTGTYNNFFGYQAGYNSTTGGSNNFFGNQAGYNSTTGGSNNFFGYQAGRSNTTGGSNNFFGNQAGRSNTTGGSNNFFGNQAGYNSTTGSYNNFFGNQAGYNSTTGSYNNSFGYQAGYNSTTGSYNNFFGNQAGYNSTTGTYNNFFGNQAGYNSTTGTYNNFFGYQAGRSNTTGTYNNFFGYQAGYNSTAGDTLTGDGNVLIGYQVGDNIRFDADNNVAIGYGIDLPVQNGDNQLVLSNLIFGTGASGTGTTTAGKVGIRTNAPNRELEVSGEVRITDLTTDTPTRIVGADADGDLGALTLGTGVTIDAGVLNVAASAVSDGDKGDIDVTSSGATWTIDTNAVTTVKINAGAVTSAKLATGAVTGAVYGTVYYVPVDSINYDATTDLATYSEIHYYMYTGAGATANQVLTVPAASSTYAGKKIYVVSDDADQLDAYGLAVTSSSGATIRYYSGGDTGFSDNASYASFGHGEGPNAVLFVCVQNPRTLAYRWVAYDGIRGGY